MLYCWHKWFYCFKIIFFASTQVQKMAKFERNSKTTDFSPPNTTEFLQNYHRTHKKTITEHLKVTTENMFFITIREFLISCWETKFYHETSKNGWQTLLFYPNVHIFTKLILTAEHFLLQPIDLIFMQKSNHLRNAYY